MNPLVSIIVPIYNAEKYLSRCLDSILSQTFCDFEVLLIDDGSTDTSSNICEQYGLMDNRFRIYHKKNEGVAIARQWGLDQAIGKFVIHVDSDDWLEPNMLQDMSLCIMNEAADILICDYYVNTNYNQMYVEQKLSNLSSQDVLHGIFQTLHGGLWNKLVRKSCIDKSNAHFFPKINYCEDVLFWVQLLQNASLKICYWNQAYYHYYMNENSITHVYSMGTYKMKGLYFQKLCSLLPDGFGYEKRKVRLEILIEGYQHRVINNIQMWKELVFYNKKAAFGEARLRWRVGCCALVLGLFPLAKRLLQN